MWWQLTPIEWTVVYPVHPHDPIGHIRRQVDGFDAHLAAQHLGLFDSGDAAVEAIWTGYVELAHAQHAAMSRVHGGYDRHRPSG